MVNNETLTPEEETAVTEADAALEPEPTPAESESAPAPTSGDVLVQLPDGRFEVKPQ